MKIISKSKFICLWMALATFFAACQKPMEEVTDANYPRTFSPINLRVEPETFDRATVTWGSVEDARLYVLELSRDSLKFENFVAYYETESPKKELTGLWGSETYSVRVKVKAFKDDQEDSKWTSRTFRTQTEYIFFPAGADDLEQIQITLRWNPFEEVTHLVCRKRDGDFEPEIVIPLTLGDIVAGEKMISGLTPDTRYTIVMHKGEQQRGSINVRTNSDNENIVYYIGNDDIKASKLTVRWMFTQRVTHLSCRTEPDNGEEPVIVPITPADIAASAKTVTGLKPSTQYSVTICNGEQKRGSVTATTRWRPTENLVLATNGTHLNVYTSNAANIGKIILLPEGYAFDAPFPCVLAGAMTIMGDPDADIKPTFNMTSTVGGQRLFNWANLIDTDGFRFENIRFQGGPGNGNRIFSPNASERVSRIDAITFENCEIFDLGRGIIALPNVAETKPIGTISFNNCIVRNISATGAVPDQGIEPIFHVSLPEGGINNIVITNSTFQRQYHNLVNAMRNETNNPVKNIRIENCTFDDFITGPLASAERFFIDGNDNTELSITIRDVIFGRSGTAAATMSSQYRVGSGSTVTVSNSHKTADHHTHNNFPNVTIYSGASTDLWVNPANGDFRFKDSRLGRTGDPRWWQ